MNELITILVIISIVAIGWHMISIRELALRTVKRYCLKMEVQFLDGSVSPSGYSLSRNKQGVVALEQRFAFEFSSTGEKRYKGQAIFVGSQLTHIELEPHIMRETLESTAEITHDDIKH